MGFLIFLCAILALFLTLSAQAQEVPHTIDLDASGNLVWIDLEGNVLGPVEIGPVSAPTGVPLAYELDDDLKPVSSSFLGDPEAIAKAAAAVAAQGKAK